jgi:hypothetical protein
VARYEADFIQFRDVAPVHSSQEKELQGRQLVAMMALVKAYMV